MKISLWIACGMILVHTAVHAQPGDIGNVTAVEGRVDVSRSGDPAIPLSGGSPILVGDIVRTKDHSKASIAFSDKSTLEIAPNSRVEIREFKVSGTAREHAEIFVMRGKVFADVSRTGRPDTFVITTPNARGKVKGTEVLVVYQAEKTSALVKDGRLAICNTALPEQIAEVGGGEAILVPARGAPGIPRPFMDSEFALHKKDTKPVAFAAKALSKDAAKISGIVTTLVGGVRIYKKGAADWHYAKQRETIEEGDKIETADDGRVSVLFENGNVIQIQNNSRVVCATLVRDPKTGEFENTFESDAGRIKAVVERLGKNSSFRVKTPTAVCGVRGTVMYINVGQGSTQAFYEGGGGIITNPVSGDSQFVESGQNAVSMDTGQITAPLATSDEARTTLDVSYDYGVVQGSYAAPENTTTASGEGAPQAPATTGTAGGAVATTGGESLQPPPDLVPITEANRPEPVSGVSYIEKLSFSGDVGMVANVSGEASFVPEANNRANGNFSLSVSVDNEWETVGKGSVTGYVTSNANIPGWYAFWIDNDVICSTSNNGQYRGFLGASLATSTDPDKPTLLGKALCLYRDPSGWAGTMTFLFSGHYVSSSKYFYTVLDDSEDVVFTPREFYGTGYDLNSQTLVTGTMHGRGVGYFEVGAGSLSCGNTGSNSGLTGKTFDLLTDWGIWQFQAQGDYSTLGVSDRNDWTLALGGERIPGTKWIGSVIGDSWDDFGPTASNQISGEFRGFAFYKEGVDGGGHDVFHGGYILNAHVTGMANPTDGTFQIIGGGEFLMAYKNFTSDKLGFTETQLGNFVNVPITQAAISSDIHRTGGAAQFTSFNMNARVYSNAVGSFWGGDITGTFQQSNQPANGWTVTLSGTTPDTVSITLKDGTWDASQRTWSAVVDTAASPAIGTYTITNGQAGGTITFDGDSSTIEGIAAGTASLSIG